jgi:hypothetical protein
VGTRVGLDDVEKRNFFYCRESNPGRPACSYVNLLLNVKTYGGREVQIYAFLILALDACVSFSAENRITMFRSSRPLVFQPGVREDILKGT